MTPLAVVVALLVGITLGLLGAGGSILTVPALIFALDVEPKLAIVMALPIVGGAALVGAIRQWMLRNIDVRATMAFGAANVIGAYIGAVLARGLRGDIQLLALWIVILAAAITMFTSHRRVRTREQVATERRGVTVPLLLLGVGSGMVTGIVGIGGGFILVPVLVVLGGLPMREAVGTSLTVIAMNTAAAFVGYHSAVAVPWATVLWFGGLTAIGVLIGGASASRVPDRALRLTFSSLLVVVLVMLAFRLKSLFGA